MQNFKSEVLATAIKKQEENVGYIKDAMARISQSRDSETKSSAGDKHEVGRAMMQLEQEKLGIQLDQANAILEVLYKVNLSIKPVEIGFGSLVDTNKGHFFLAAAVGKLTINEQITYVISMASPIGMAMLGKTIGESFSFNNNSFDIINIC
jgi:transcription elongation GreA/GreB family factor